MALAVIITKPGYDTVRLGPYAYEHLAEQAAATLRQGLVSVQHPEGTTIGLGRFDPAYEHTWPNMPTDAEHLAMTIDADTTLAGDGTGANYPDLYERLAAWVGHDEAGPLWSRACDILDHVTAAVNADEDDGASVEVR